MLKIEGITPRKNGNDGDYGTGKFVNRWKPGTSYSQNKVLKEIEGNVRANKVSGQFLNFFPAAGQALNISRLPGFLPQDSSFGTSILETRESPLQPEQHLSHQPPLGQSLVSVGSSVCRICHTNTVRERLISPCRCKGTLAFVHLSCLERWLNQSCRSYCELCRYHFNAVETPRYRWPEALRIWISHPRNRRHIQSDLLILTLLTVVTVGLLAVCLLGMRYFVIEGKKIGISRIWTKGAISFFLTIVVLGYVTTVYLLIKDQMSPWYRWWKNTVNVRLVMDLQESFRRLSIESLPDRGTQSTPSSRAAEDKVGDSDETGI